MSDILIATDCFNSDLPAIVPDDGETTNEKPAE